MSFAMNASVLGLLIQVCTFTRLTYVIFQLWIRLCLNNYRIRGWS
jgi:hypothetical protein